MSKFFARIFLSILLLSLFESENAVGQTTPPPPALPDVPAMWVSRLESISRRAAFANASGSASTVTKADVFNQILGHQKPSTFLPYSEMDKLIQAFRNGGEPSGVRVWFGSFKSMSSNPPDLTGFTDGQFVLIYSSVTCADASGQCERQPDTGPYFIVSPSDSQFKLIPASVKDEFVSNYQNRYLQALRQTIIPNDPANMDGNGVWNDTRAIYYEWSHWIKWFEDERHYQATNARGILGIDIKLVSYPDSGVRDISIGGIIYRDRLSLIYEFVGDTSQPGEARYVYIDDTNNFCHRPPLVSCTHGALFFGSDGIQRTDGANNGHLCPPTCR